MRERKSVYNFFAYVCVRVRVCVCEWVVVRPAYMVLFTSNNHSPCLWRCHTYASRTYTPAREWGPGSCE